MLNASNIQVDLHGLFDYNSTFDYDEYNYVADCASEGSSDGTIFIPILYSVVVVLGMLGNVMVLAVLWQKCRKWRMMDIFILHLSIADFLLLLIMPLWAVEAANEWIFGKVLCKLAGGLVQVHFYCIIFLLACISLDHYLSIIHGVKIYPCKKPWLHQFTCLGTWLFSLLLSIPDWRYLQTKSNLDEDKIECIHWYLSDEQRLAFRLLHFVVGFIFPVVVLLFCYSSIFLQLKRGSKGLQKQPAMWFNLALVVAFIISWMPYNITLLLDTIQNTSSTELSEECWQRWTALRITAVLGFLRSCLNPFIYFGLSRKFRHWVLTFPRCRRADTSDIFFQWDSEQVDKSASVSPEEKCSEYPLSDIGQSV